MEEDTENRPLCSCVYQNYGVVDMKVKPSCVLLLFVFIFVLFTNVIEVNAMNTWFSVEELNKEGQNVFVLNLGISLLTVEPAKRGVLCFDVNAEGMIAIGRKGSHSKEVCVYSSDGTFLYGYTFNCSQSFAVEWDDKCINIYFVRSDVIISLDPDGNILDIKKVQDTTNNNTHRNDLLYSTSRIVDDTTYVIRNDMGVFNWIASSYSQIITIDATGSECIVYDASSTLFFHTVALFVVIFVFVSIAIVGVVWQFIRLRREN